MGRALFSTQIYREEPVVVTSEPTASEDPQRCQYQTWSALDNNFDPDSEEFFQNAQYEAFLDGPPRLTVEGNRREPERITEDAEDGSDSDTVDTVSTPISSHSSDGEQGSPMAVGSDDPASMIAAAYGSSARPSREDATQDWERRLLLGGYLGRTAMDDAWSSIRSEGTRTDGTSPTSENETEGVALRTSGNATPPIDIPRDPTMPQLVPRSPESPSSPSFVFGTPSQREQQITPASVSPRLYTWNASRRGFALYGTPTRRATPAGGESPLTNANARLSVPRIVTPARIRVEGFTA